MNSSFSLFLDEEGLGDGGFEVSSSTRPRLFPETMMDQEKEQH